MYPPEPSYLEPVDRRLSDAESSDGTAENSDDEFDWDVDEDTNQDQARTFAALGGGTTKATRAKRGRRIYMWFKGLSRWFRALLAAFIGFVLVSFSVSFLSLVRCRVKRLMA